jgi:acetolactate synthase regulatory subunit
MTIYRTFETVLQVAQMTSHSGFTVVEEHNIRQGEASYAEIEQCVLGRTLLCYTTCAASLNMQAPKFYAVLALRSYAEWIMLNHI